jgi:hypothetical protein
MKVDRTGTRRCGCRQRRLVHGNIIFYPDAEQGGGLLCHLLHHMPPQPPHGRLLQDLLPQPPFVPAASLLLLPLYFLLVLLLLYFLFDYAEVRELLVYISGCSYAHFFLRLCFD